MLNIVKKAIKKILPYTLKKKLSTIYTRFKLTQQKQKHFTALNKVRKKSIIKVVFFIIHEPAWKCEGIYKLLNEDERFEPIVIVNPWTVFGQENMIKEMNTCYNYFKTNEYNVLKTFDEVTGEWLDVKKEIKPDIVFFTNPYLLTKKEYFTANFLNTLTCYIPYGYMMENMEQQQFNQDFHIFLWKGFYETSIHKTMAEKHARNKGENIEVSGAPFCDIFLDKDYIPKNDWKIKDNKVKRIIWAPHHTINENKDILAYSNFLKYHQYIFDLLNLYKGKIQIAFKPHPMLKLNLYKHPDWGKNKTDVYYNKWESIDNGQLEESNYEDLFLTSDAMILDSMSFIVEYFFTNKPSLFTVRDETIQTKFNEFGSMIFKQLYKGYSEYDITNFIDSTVLGGKDLLKNNRTEFLNRYLIPPNNITASNNIYNTLVKEVSNI